MVIANIDRKNGPAVADGVQTTFPYSFRIFTAAQIQVFQDDTEVNAALFTVTGVDAVGGGNVIFNTAPDSGDIIWIFGDTTVEQPTKYPPQGPFPALSHETGLDRSIMVLREFDEELERRPALKQAVLTALRNLEFPSPGANKVIGWNALGTALTLFDSVGQQVTPVPGTGEVNAIVEVTIGFTNGDTLASDPLLVGLIPSGVRVKMVTVEVLVAIGGPTTFSVGGMGQIDGWGGNILVAFGTENVTPNRGDQPFTRIAEDVQIIASDAVFNGAGSLKVRVHTVAFSTA